MSDTLKPPSSTSRPRRSIIPPARLGSTPPHPAPQQLHQHLRSTSSSSKTLPTLPALKLEPPLQDLQTMAVEPPVPTPALAPASSSFNSMFSLPVLKRQTPVPAASLALSGLGGGVQDDEEPCPSCVGATVPAPTVVGTWTGGGAKGKGKAQQQAAATAATGNTLAPGELIWICCENCETWFHYACVRTRAQGLPEALGPDHGHWKNELDSIDKWFCTDCASPSRIPTLKKSARPTAAASSASARKSARSKAAPNYLDLHLHTGDDPSSSSGGVNGMDWPSRFEVFEGQGKITVGGYVEVRGEDVRIENVGTRAGWEDEEVGLLACPVVARANGMNQGLSEEREIAKMGGVMPDAEVLTVSGIAELNGRDTPVEVVDVANQGSSKVVPGTVDSKWTLGAWADYYDLPADKKPGTFNIISYEITGTPLASMVRPPKIVSELDWVDRFWPSGDKAGVNRPKVQLYCLMSPSGCFTDWHVDFAGSSVYYHILKGSKVFWFIRPTKQNLDAYARWSDSANQSTAWLGDQVDKVWKIVLGPGDTMIIPSGWIHAVYTPSDSLVFGGNFLHSFDIRTQIRMRDIEIATRVPQKFRFPRFTRLCWYVAHHYLTDLQAHQKLRPITSKAAKAQNPIHQNVNGADLKSEPSNGTPIPTSSSSSEPFSPRLLDNLLVLASFLVRQVRHRERGTGGDGGGEKENDTVPWEKVKDPAGLARELRWRVRLARGEESEDEREDVLAKGGRSRKGKGKEEREDSVDANGAGSSKKRRTETGESASSVRSNGNAKVAAKRSWDENDFSNPTISTRSVHLARPGASSMPVPAIETTRLETQTRSRQRFEPNGETALEISTASRTIISVVWDPAPPPSSSYSTSAPVLRRVVAPPPPPPPALAPAAPSPAPAPLNGALPPPPATPRDLPAPSAYADDLPGSRNGVNGYDLPAESSFLDFGAPADGMDVDVVNNRNVHGYGMLGAQFGGEGEGGDWSRTRE